MPASHFWGAGMSVRKFCATCGVVLVPGENWSSGLFNTKNYLCRLCNSAKGKIHYQANKERADRLQRERLARPAVAKHASEYKSAYYAKNKEQWKKYRETQKKKENTEPWHRAGRLMVWVRARAAKNGMDFDLDREWVEKKLSVGVCEITGIKFELGRTDSGRFNPWGPSIDRINSSHGYTKDNCRMVVWIYNMAKAEWDDEIVLEMAKALVTKNKTA